MEQDNSEKIKNGAKIIRVLMAHPRERFSMRALSSEIGLSRVKVKETVDYLLINKSWTKVRKDKYSGLIYTTEKLDKESMEEYHKEQSHKKLVQAAQMLILHPYKSATQVSKELSMPIKTVKFVQSVLE